MKFTFYFGSFGLVENVSSKEEAVEIMFLSETNQKYYKMTKEYLRDMCLISSSNEGQHA